MQMEHSRGILNLFWEISPADFFPRNWWKMFEILERAIVTIAELFLDKVMTRGARGE